jgi:hypothetical protein
MFAFIRIMDYLVNEGAAFTDGNCMERRSSPGRTDARKLVRGDRAKR